MTSDREGPHRGMLVVGGLIVIACGLVGLIFFPHDRAVRFPVTGAAVGAFLVVMGVLIVVVNLVKRHR